MRHMFYSKQPTKPLKASTLSTGVSIAFVTGVVAMRKLVGFAFALLIVVLASQRAFAQSAITINESLVRLSLAGDSLRIALPVDNRTQAALAANISLDLITPDGSVQTHAAQTATLRPGQSQIAVSLPPIGRAGVLDRSDLIWSRLRYSVTAPPVDAVGATGIIAVSEITPKLFELHVADSPFATPGSAGTILVRAVHPGTLRPIAGVTVKASIDLDSPDRKPLLTNEATTDRNGLATLRFSLPEEINTDEVAVSVTGTLDSLQAEASGMLPVNHSETIRISSDKPLYQPGQTAHMRMIVLDAEKKAIVQTPLTLRVRDEDDTLIFRTDVDTSRFGIASADWPIPENSRLGTYQVSVRMANSDEDGPDFRTEIKISRYDLPSFEVRVQADRKYYLPGQNAELDVAADYLFGKPVTRGHVRVVRETERQWNFREQKWDTKSAESYEGDTNNQGHYIAHLDLADAHTELSGDDYERFQDLSFTAYLTDSSTGRTEQRRFDVRITKEPIHIYTIGLDGTRSQKIPLEFYVSVDYADGSPAECDVNVNWAADDSRSPASGVLLNQGFLRRIRTNRYGIAKVTGLNLPPGADAQDIYLNFRATDRKGLIGHHNESLPRFDGPAIRVKTDKTLYAPNDPIAIDLVTSEPDVTLVVEATHHFDVLTQRLMHIRNGHASLVIPSNTSFQNDVSIAAFQLGGKNESRFNTLLGSHTVYFPARHDLRVNVRLSQPAYKPGEDASVRVNVTGPNGDVKQVALGLVAVDKALEERVEADSDLNSDDGFYAFRQIFDRESTLQGIRLSDLDHLDLTKPLPDGFELVAEALLQNSGYSPEIFSSDDEAPSPNQAFSSAIGYVVNPVRVALQKIYDTSGKYPSDEVSFRDELTAAGIREGNLIDPWGMPYKAVFQPEGGVETFALRTAGPDKVFGTDDDFSAIDMSWPYFKPVADAIQKTVIQFHKRTGGYIRDEQTLKSELARIGIDLASLNDPWGHPYRADFGVSGSNFTVTIISAGPNGRFERANPPGDDVTLSVARINYFADASEQIDDALASAYNRDHVFPASIAQFRQILQTSGIQWDALRDPWDHPYYATFRQDAEYTDNVTVQTYQTYLGQAEKRITVTPVTRQINFLYLRSAGGDGVEGTADDFTVGVFSRFLFDESAIAPIAGGAATSTVLAGSTGAISGEVKDASGALVPGTSIRAQNEESNLLFDATTDDEGRYVLRNLPAGAYTVHFLKEGFQNTIISEVPVRSSNITSLDTTLQVGSTAQTVTVTGEAPQVNTTSSSLGAQVKALPPPQQSVFTPRLREYFPETLFWQPELITDKGGRAQIRLPLADNITTWKLSVVASTEDGQIGTADKEIRAFQPFFAEHDPPRYLTEGDEIDLPVVLRNYLDRELPVTTELTAEDWFATLSSVSIKTIVPPDDSRNETFKFRATKAVTDGKQKITATSVGTGDAIERKITVRPNGEEQSITSSQVFGDSGLISIRVPEQAISGSTSGTLKIYPNLQDHLLESIEAILERPDGCAEQVISASYPNLLLLRYAQNSGGVSASQIALAKRNLEIGYQRLLSFMGTDGGVTYWGRGNADPALTAYAMKFLNDTRKYISVDDSAADTPMLWLLHSAPQEDGRWIARDWQGKEDPRQSALLTAYISRTIAATLSAQVQSNTSQHKDEALARIKKALNYLESETNSIDEPYLIASYGLASLSAGDAERTANSVRRLLSLERQQGDTSYWSLETNTPFYGWGQAGRIETTALVLQLLDQAGANGGEMEQERTRALLFLLRNQDRFGVWFSTQATVTVLDALGSAFAGRSGAPSANPPSAEQLTILVDGQQAASIDLPRPGELTGPLLADLGKFLTPGSHEIAFRKPGTSQVSAQLVVTYYQVWPAGASSEDTHQEPNSSEALHLNVQFDKKSARVGEEIVCSVNAERVGFRGYGMMLAEIGLPPGADVDRASLDRAMMDSGWELSRYDVLPDRIVVYLWPRAGGTKFSFSIKARFGLKARSVRSVLYDYYNPDAYTVVPPADFVVQ